MIFKPRTANENATALIYLLDSIALFALFSTGEISLWVFAISAAIFTASRLVQKRLSDSTMVATLLIIILGAVAVALKFKLHPITVVAHGTPLFHAWLWLATSDARFRSWRIGMGFVGLVLAAALTPDFHIFALIILFIVACSLAISSVFLDNSLKERAPAMARRPLPDGFFRYSVSLSLVIFLTSLLIFPLLPRTRLGAGVGFNRADIGYNEEVSVSEWTRFAEGQDGRIVLRIFFPSQMSEDLGFSLIRGKVLESFNGKEWIAAVKRVEEEVSADVFPAPPDKTFEAISEPFASTVLLLPYGATEVKPISQFSKIRRASSGEWLKAAVPSQRMRYQFEWIPGGEKRIVQDDLPRELHIRTGSYPARSKMEALAARVMPRSLTPEGKLIALGNFFKEGFEGSIREEGRRGVDPLLQFLETKRGHCELFASSAALLLRHAGIPSRLVVGFRVSRPPVGGVLNVSNMDAHAWVEAYLPKKGWRVLDVTPGLIPQANWAEYLSRSYDAVSAYWFRYILSFDAESQMDLRKQLTQTVPKIFAGKGMGASFSGATWFRSLIATTVSLLAFGLFAWSISKFVLYIWYGSRYSIGLAIDRQKLLRAERRRLEKVRKQGKLSQDRLQQWQESYNKHRFSRDFDLRTAKSELRRYGT